MGFYNIAHVDLQVWGFISRPSVALMKTQAPSLPAASWLAPGPGIWAFPLWCSWVRTELCRGQLARPLL